MPHTSTVTTVQVLAGDHADVGILKVTVAQMKMNSPRTTPDDPPYDYQADATVVVQFLYQFLPEATYNFLVADILRHYPNE